MTELAIEVTDLTKKYRLYDKPIDRLKESLNPFKKQYHKDFYALNKVTFKIKKGETVGIIGKNGAGKSTLLKIITGVLTPTSGSIRTYGRISSLLELGAGFNPEMTGIENIYLQGSLFGITHRAMEENIQEILDFADIGDFIYQPVKSYSSGMFARLAFAVAINVEPDLLIIDEALSVGDAKFQRKCFAKFEELQNKKVTILFVSHDIESIKSYTTKSLYLKNGKNSVFGYTDVVVNKYMRDIFPEEGNKLSNLKKEKNKDNYLSSDEYIIPKSDKIKKFGLGYADVRKISIKGMNRQIFRGRENVSFIVEILWDSNSVLNLCNRENLKKNIIFGMYIENAKNDKIFAFNTYLADHMINIDRGHYYFELSLLMPILAPGEYFLVPSIALGTHRVHTQLCWYDYYGIIVSSPEKSNDFLGKIEIKYNINEVSNDF